MLHPVPINAGSRVKHLDANPRRLVRILWPDASPLRPGSASAV